MCLSSLPRPKLEFCSFLCHSQAGFFGISPPGFPGQASQQSGCYPASRPHPRSSDMLPADVRTTNWTSWGWIQTDFKTSVELTKCPLHSRTRVLPQYGCLYIHNIPSQIAQNYKTTDDGNRGCKHRSVCWLSPHVRGPLQETVDSFPSHGRIVVVGSAGIPLVDYHKYYWTSYIV